MVKGDVLADRTREKRRLLEHDDDLLAQIVQRHVAHVATVTRPSVTS